MLIFGIETFAIISLVLPKTVFPVKRGLRKDGQAFYPCGIRKPQAINGVLNS
ncbi:hypothetical protein BH10ACI2_BH10ACI2_17290 [soil metagenome]